MRRWRWLFGVGLLAAVVRVTAPGPAAPPEPAASFTKDVVPFLTKHCYTCHGNGKKRADLALDQYPDEAAVEKDRKLWENVRTMVRSGEMPPKERPRPPAAGVEAALTALDAVLPKFDCTG